MRERLEVLVSRYFATSMKKVRKWRENRKVRVRVMHLTLTSGS